MNTVKFGSAICPNELVSRNSASLRCASLFLSLWPRKNRGTLNSEFRHGIFLLRTCNNRKISLNPKIRKITGLVPFFFQTVLNREKSWFFRQNPDRKPELGSPATLRKNLQSTSRLSTRWRAERTTRTTNLSGLLYSGHWSITIQMPVYMSSLN